MNKILNVLILGLAFVLSACGGGGGGGSTPTPVTHSISGTTVPGATLNLTKTTPSTTASTTADINGNFVFSGVGDSSYVVTPMLSGYTFSPANQAVVMNGADVTGVNFTGASTTVQSYSISGSVTGGVQAGVTITVTPGNVTTTTLADGSFTLSGFVNNTYTVTPTYSSNPTFSPSATLQAVVNGANVTGVNFTTPVPMQTTGISIYECGLIAICSEDLSSSTISALWTSSSLLNMVPVTVIPSRLGGVVASQGSNYGDCTAMMSLTSPPLLLTVTSLCAAPTSVGNSHFDISQSGEAVVMAKSFPPAIPGFPSTQNIVLYKLDGSGTSVRVTNGTDVDSSPVFGNGCVFGAAGAAGICDLYFVRNGTSIWKQTVDTVNLTTVGSATLFESNVVGGMRTMSFNANYSQVALMKNVGGVSYVAVKNVATGVVVVLVSGIDPYWALDGSNRIKYTIKNTLLISSNSTIWSIMPDGTGKAQIPTPANINKDGQGNASEDTLSKLVFKPL